MQPMRWYSQLQRSDWSSEWLINSLTAGKRWSQYLKSRWSDWGWLRCKQQFLRPRSRALLMARPVAGWRSWTPYFLCWSRRSQLPFLGLSYITCKVEVIIHRIVPTVIIVKPRVLEFRPGGVLKVILSGPQLMPPCIKMWLFHLFMLRRIKQPAWVYRAGRGWSGDAILDYRMSEAIQPHLTFSSPSQEDLCPLCPSLCARLAMVLWQDPILLWSCHSLLPHVSPVTTISPLPTVYPNSKREQGRAAGRGSGLRELWFQFNSDTNGMSRFCKPLLLSGFQNQKEPWFYLLKTRQVYNSPKYISCTSPVPVNAFRQYTEQLIIK